MGNRLLVNSRSPASVAGLKEGFPRLAYLGPWARLGRGAREFQGFSFRRLPKGPGGPGPFVNFRNFLGPWAQESQQITKAITKSQKSFKIIESDLRTSKITQNHNSDLRKNENHDFDLPNSRQVDCKLLAFSDSCFQHFLTTCLRKSAENTNAELQSTIRCNKNKAMRKLRSGIVYELLC